VRQSVVALVVVVLVAGACSGSEDAAPRTTTTSDRTPSSSTTVPAYSGDPQSPFCNLLRGVDTRSVLEGDPTDPVAVEAAFRRLVGVLRDALALSPPEIEADLALVSEGIDTLDATLAAVGYDYEALAASGQAPKLSEAVNDPAFTEAGARLGAYRTQVCQL
jgi:hypothetical protein